MRTLSYAQSLARFDEVLDSVVDDQEEVIITRGHHHARRRGSAVIVSLDEYEALKETVHLLRSPANAHRLLDAIERLETGRGQHLDLPAAN